MAKTRKFTKEEQAAWDEARAERERRRAENRANWVQRNYDTSLEVAEKKSAHNLSELNDLKNELAEQIGEFRKSFDEGARILGDNFPDLMQKHVDLALSESRDGIQARQFLLRHFSTMIPASDSDLSQNDTLMAKGLEAIKQGRAKLVERSIEMIPEEREVNRIDFDPRYDVEGEYEEEPD